MKRLMTVFLAVLFLLIAIPLFAEPENQNNIPIPIINILAPVNGYTTDKNTMDVQVSFQSSAKDKKGKCQGNIKTVVILLDSHIAVKYNISRQEQDEFALASNQKALAATKSGVFKEEIVPVEVKQKKEVKLFNIDEHPS